jgi:acylphosphatase
MVGVPPQPDRNSATKVVRHIVVHGRVQGVFYRGWSVATARGLGLDGWVRNRSDGSVEMVLAGPLEAVEAMIGQCKQGPPAARVGQVIVEETKEVVGTGFEQRRSL